MKLEIITDFRGQYYIVVIEDQTDEGKCNFALFQEEYFNLDSQEVLVGLPELEPSTHYELECRVVGEWDHEHVDFEFEVVYTKDSLIELGKFRQWTSDEK